jgi:hypothetical protein
MTNITVRDKYDQSIEVGNNVIVKYYGSIYKGTVINIKLINSTGTSTSDFCAHLRDYWIKVIIHSPIRGDKEITSKSGEIIRI